jgi:hypothetical protein
MLLNFYANGSVTSEGWEAYYEIDNVGMEESPLSENLFIYPNPASNKLNIEFTATAGANYQLEMMSLTGEVILSKKIDMRPGNSTQILDISGFSKGIYMLRIWNEKDILNRKIIVE